MAHIWENDNGSAIHEAKLHNSVENIVKTATYVNCQEMNDPVYVFGNSLVYFYVLEKKKSPNIDITQPVIIYSKLKIETLEQDIKYVLS